MEGTTKYGDVFQPHKVTGMCLDSSKNGDDQSPHRKNMPRFWSDFCGHVCMRYFNICHASTMRMELGISGAKLNVVEFVMHLC